MATDSNPADRNFIFIWLLHCAQEANRRRQGPFLPDIQRYVTSRARNALMFARPQMFPMAVS